MMYTKEQLILAEKNNTLNKVYGDLVNMLIRNKYSISEELSLFRQQHEKPEEYAEYYSFAEECKSQAKTILQDIMRS